MKRLTASAPTRVDLAGGTLDIWPLNLLVKRALTVNVAIDLRASTLLEDLPSDVYGAGARKEIRSEDQGISETWNTGSSPPESTKLPLIGECIRFFDAERGFRLTTKCAAPAGSGLGGSSALAISLLGGLRAFLGRPMMPPEDMVLVARDLEARVLGIPTGTQDHVAAVFGGAMAIRYGAGPPVREPLAVDLEALGDRLVLAYSGATRQSGRANWDMIRRAVEGDAGTRSALESIASIAHDMRVALRAADLDIAGELLGKEWEQRRKLSDLVTTPAIEKALEAARAAGAIAGKACGAGGGGCIVFLCRAGTRPAVEKALAALQSDGVQPLPARPTRVGLQLAG